MAVGDDDFVRFLKCEMESTALRFGIPAQAAKDIAQSLEETVRRRYNGGRPYIARADRDELRRQVIAEFNGANAAAVCAKYGIRKRTLYRYLGAARKKKAEPSLA